MTTSIGGGLVPSNPTSFRPEGPGATAAGVSRAKPYAHVSQPILSGLVRLGEFGVLVAAGFAMAILWLGIEETFESSRYVTAILITAAFAVVTAERLELYRMASLLAPLRSAPVLVLAWTTAMATQVAVVFLLKAGPEFSRGWLLLWFVAGFIAAVSFRYTVSLRTHQWSREGRLNRRAVVFGAGPEGRTLIAALEADRESDVLIRGVFDDRGPDRVPELVDGYRLLGNVDELVQFCRREPVDLLIVSLPITAERRLLEILRKLWVLPVNIRLAAHTNRLRFRPRAYSFIGQVPLLDLFDKPIADWDNFVKSTFDKAMSAVALLLLSPLMLLIAVAIKIDSRGPVLFRQKRFGFNNELIEVLKFRSMHVEQQDPEATKLVTRDDPRVTRVGRFIRRTSLDELPQLVNVLTGSLSLVGPRPHAVQARAADRLYHEVVDGYFARHRVKPGITGWAQIHGWRGETDTPEKIQKRVEHDLYYIENWSLLLDLYILLRTPYAMLTLRNAF